MQTIRERLEQHFSQAETEIENEVLSFYISFLMDADLGKMLKTATRIITRAQRQILRVPKGENEREALEKFSVTKISYLSAQLRDTLTSITAELQIEDEGLPETIGKRFNEQLAELLEKALAAMENEIYKNLCIDISAQELSRIQKAVLRKFIKNVVLEAETYYAKAAQYQVLMMQGEAGLKAANGSGTEKY